MPLWRWYVGALSLRNTQLLTNPFPHVNAADVLGSKGIDGPLSSYSSDGRLQQIALGAVVVVLICDDGAFSFCPIH